MRIVVVGTRGIPDIQGGVETHCQELYPRIVAKGHEVILMRRSTYVASTNKMPRFRGVRLMDIYAPRIKSLEAIVHTFAAIVKARKLHPDLLHVHAIGPALMIPFARLLGMKVVMTNHGPDYDRQKWGRLAKFILRTGERMGSKFSNGIIVISPLIRDIVKTNYKRDSTLIFNGVNAPQPSGASDYVESLGLTPGKYIVALGRFVKEKGFDDLINAYRTISNRGVRLVIAGDADHPDDYSRSLKKLASDNDVVLPGFIKGEKLSQLMSNARLYVMSSYHEGLPIALLEAMSYKLDAIVSDITANRLSALAPQQFYPVGNITALASLLQQRIDATPIRREYDLTPYNWDFIADQTLAFYSKVLSNS